jgi:signal transduction histidine kinase
MLDDLGLVPTLLWHFERYRAQTGIDVRFHHRGLAGHDGIGDITIFRIVQEALTNIARHAGVAEARVELWTEGDRVRIRVSDQGTGFQPDRVGTATSGLTGMRERALLLGGTLSVDSAPGTGTTVDADLPLRTKERA